MIFANMHNHSTFSDGAYTPEKLIELGKQQGHSAVVLTDHDTVRGTYFMNKAARKAGLLTLLGCEFSTKGLGSNFHLLGFDFNPYHREMSKMLEYTSSRQTRVTEEYLNIAIEKGHFKGITWQDVKERYPYNDYICNNHVFEMLVERKIRTPEEYYTNFFADFQNSADPERRKYVYDKIDMPVPDVEKMIKLILDSGGVPVLAHPHNRIEYIDKLRSMGLMGLEVNHPDLQGDESAVLNKIADYNNMYKTGGTDHSGTLGGYDHLNDSLKVDPHTASVDEKDFMNLYTRKLG